jgi:hypothetical protein
MFLPHRSQYGAVALLREGNEGVEFKADSRKEIYAWTQATLSSTLQAVRVSIETQRIIKALPIFCPQDYAMPRMAFVHKASRNRSPNKAEAKMAAVDGAKVPHTPLIAEVPEKMINHPFMSFFSLTINLSACCLNWPVCVNGAPSDHAYRCESNWIGSSLGPLSSEAHCEASAPLSPVFALRLIRRLNNGNQRAAGAIHDHLHRAWLQRNLDALDTTRPDCAPSGFRGALAGMLSDHQDLRRKEFQM